MIDVVEIVSSHALICQSCFIRVSHFTCEEADAMYYRQLRCVDQQSGTLETISKKDTDELIERQRIRSSSTIPGIHVSIEMISLSYWFSSRRSDRSANRLSATPVHFEVNANVEGFVCRVTLFIEINIFASSGWQVNWYEKQSRG